MSGIFIILTILIPNPKFLIYFYSIHQRLDFYAYYHSKVFLLLHSSHYNIIFCEICSDHFLYENSFSSRRSVELRVLLGGQLD